MQTSLLDIDETRDTSGYDPLSLDDRPGEAPERPLDASSADNDGLYQRYDESCGPATMEALLGEADPAYALRRRAPGRLDIAPAAADDIQAQIVAEYELDPGSRVAARNIVGFRQVVDSAVRDGRLNDAQAREVRAYVLGTPQTPKTPLVDGALAALRAANGGFPDEAQVAGIRAYTPPPGGREWGRIGFAIVEKLLDRIVGKDLGVDYKLRSLYGEAYRALPRDQAARLASQFVMANLDCVERNLEEGTEVVFGTSWPDHFWSMTAVKGDRPDRSFLVHDPWSGRTKWVPEAAIVDGSFSKQFMGESKTSTYVDMIYLVE